MADTRAHTTGEVVEVRCNLPECPQPVIGVYLPEMHAAHGSKLDEDYHWWRVHEIPARQKEALEGINSALESAIPDAGAVMAEYGLPFELVSSGD